MTVTGSAATNNGVVLTLAAGQRWRGVMALSAALTGAAGSGVLTATPAVVWASTGTVDPPTGAVVARCALSVPASGAGAALGTGATNTVVMPEISVANYDPTQSATLTLQFNGATVATATAVGEYF